MIQYYIAYIESSDILKALSLILIVFLTSYISKSVNRFCLIFATFQLKTSFRFNPTIDFQKIPQGTQVPLVRPGLHSRGAFMHFLNPGSSFLFTQLYLGAYQPLAENTLLDHQNFKNKSWQYVQANIVLYMSKHLYTSMYREASLRSCRSYYQVKYDWQGLAMISIIVICINCREQHFSRQQ